MLLAVWTPVESTGIPDRASPLLHYAGGHSGTRAGGTAPRQVDREAAIVANDSSNRSDAQWLGRAQVRERVQAGRLPKMFASHMNVPLPGPYSANDFTL